MSGLLRVGSVVIATLVLFFSMLGFFYFTFVSSAWWVLLALVSLIGTVTGGLIIREELKYL